MSMDASTLTRNLQPMSPTAGPRSARVPTAARAWSPLTARGRAKRAEAQRDWKRAQLALNEQLGVARVAALHALLDDCLATLSSHRAGDCRWLIRPCRAALARAGRFRPGPARGRRRLRGDDGRAPVDGPVPQRHQLDHRPRPGQHQPRLRRRPAVVGADAAGRRHHRRPLRRRPRAPARPAAGCARHGARAADDDDLRPDRRDRRARRRRRRLRRARRCCWRRPRA